MLEQVSGAGGGEAGRGRPGARRLLRVWGEGRAPGVWQQRCTETWGRPRGPQGPLLSDGAPCGALSAAEPSSQFRVTAVGAHRLRPGASPIRGGGSPLP